MSLGKLTVLDGVCGFGETKVVEADEKDHVLIVQDSKVITIKLLDASVINTWFPTAIQFIKSAARCQDVFENCNTVIAFDSSKIALANELSSKITDFHKGTLKKKIFSLHPRKRDHIVVFEDGSVGSLKRLLEDDEAEYPAGILRPGEKLLSVKLFDDDISSYIIFTIEKEWCPVNEKKMEKKKNKNTIETEVEIMEIDDDSDENIETGNKSKEKQKDAKSSNLEKSVNQGEQKNIVLLKCRFSLTGDEDGVVLTIRRILNLGDRSQLFSWDVFVGNEPYILIWKKSGEILQSVGLEVLNWRVILRIPEIDDASILGLSTLFCALMYSQESTDGGVLQILSIPFKIFSEPKKLKTIVHRGEGLHFVNGNLFTVGGGRIAFTPVTDLNKTFDLYLGAALKNRELENVFPDSPISLYTRVSLLLKEGKLTEIVELLRTAQDIPEDLLVDFLEVISKPGPNKHGEEDLQQMVSILLNREYSTDSLKGELSRLNIEQVINITEYVCSILAEDVSAINPDLQRRVAKWVEIVIVQFFIQLVISRDERILNLVSRLLGVMRQQEKWVKMYTNLQSLLFNMFCLEEEEEEGLPYNITILDL